MTQRKSLKLKAFTLIEMLVVIAIIAILAAALFPAITGAIEQAKASALKNKGRGIWTAVITANSEREPLGLQAVWPTGEVSTVYFGWLMGGSSPICEDLKVGVFSGSGVNPAPNVAAFTNATPVGVYNGWCTLSVSNGASIVAEDTFIFTRNIAFGASSGTTPYDTGQVINNASTFCNYPDSGPLRLTHVNIKRGIYTTYGGGCFDRRAKYLSVDAFGNPTNNLISSGASYTLGLPAQTAAVVF